MEPGFTQKELDSVKLSPEDIAHYSQPDEIKRLLLERNYYKLVLQKQDENITNTSKKISEILDTPVFITSRTYSDIFGFKKTHYPLNASVIYNRFS